MCNFVYHIRYGNSLHIYYLKRTNTKYKSLIAADAVNRAKKFFGADVSTSYMSFVHTEGRYFCLLIVRNTWN